MHRHSEIATAYALDMMTAPTAVIGVDLGFGESRTVVMYVGEGGTIYRHIEPARSPRSAKRAARAVRMARKRRRGW